MTRFAGWLPTAALSLFLAAPLAAATPCAPCAGVAVGDPFAVLPAFAAAPALADDALLVVAYDLELDGAATPAAAHAIAARGLAPWMRLAFRTPAPLAEHLDALQAELDAAATVARSRPAGARYQVLWRPSAEVTPPSAAEYAFLVKRAAVAIGGEDPDATVATQPLSPDPAWLAEFYGHDVAAYIDTLALAAGDGGPAALAGGVAKLRELDPGKPVALAGAPWPAAPRLLLADAAAAREAGFDLALFDAPAGAPDADAAAALALLANEFRGELSLDAGTRPEGAARAWSFVRGEDLALRVVAVPPAGADELRLVFRDPQLRAPVALLGAAGEVVPLGGFRRTADGVEVRLADPEAAVVLRLERASIAELEGIEEEVTVAGDRQIPVEEILRRMQAFEEAQSRRIRHWQATNATTLRFQAASGVGAFEATFEGEAFFRPGQPFDWAWQAVYLNGVRWRSAKIPEIPLLQPEKAAAMPLEILFTKEYRYALRGRETVAGRDCWAVEFEPAAPVDGRALFRGTVWVDRATSARVRTRAVQLGLTGEVISNEETIDYSPIDAAGAAVAWGADAYVLPLRTVAQQILSVVNTATVVEREVALSGVVVNGDGFDRRREEVLASSVTMVRDTDAGLRYLVAAEGAAPGERVVKEGFDSSKLFALGGVFYDDSLDYPLPLAGVNYFDLNFRGGERQLNAFFAGVLGIVNYADPRFAGSRVDVGADLFLFALSNSDQLYRDGVESVGEEIEERPARLTLNAGVPLGSFAKLSASYRIARSDYGRTDNTDDAFVLPADHWTQTVGLGLQFARSGYRLNLEADWNARSKWERWGLPGDPEYDPAAEEYLTWEVSAAKNWYLPKFRRVGLEVNYSGGEDLDRFSKYQFGFFGGNRVHGYQIGKVRAEEAFAAHATYGVEIAKLFRLDAIADAAWATDEIGGLDNELLAGVGLQGSFIGPWDTLVQVDVGTPVAGPDDGVVAYVVFLKLFD
ncbi:MAG: hypothetical protein NDJ75_08800 [Thermoanaerobaculia bacterium]|nr:hypothetical protein [Thermoanaerobaculia bacterium]